MACSYFWACDYLDRVRKDDKRSVFQNMLVLAAGFGIGKIIGLISMPIVTRLYSPEDMGVLSVFVAITTLIVPLGTLLYTVALPLPKNDVLAMNLAVATIGMLLLVSFVSLVIFSFASEMLFDLFSIQILLPSW